MSYFQERLDAAVRMLLEAWPSCRVILPTGYQFAEKPPEAAAKEALQPAMMCVPTRLGV